MIDEEEQLGPVRFLVIVHWWGLPT